MWVLSYPTWATVLLLARAPQEPRRELLTTKNQPVTCFEAGIVRLGAGLATQAVHARFRLCVLGVLNPPSAELQGLTAAAAATVATTAAAAAAVSCMLPAEARLAAQVGQPVAEAALTLTAAAGGAAGATVHAAPPAAAISVSAASAAGCPTCGVRLSPSRSVGRPYPLKAPPKRAPR